MTDTLPDTAVEDSNPEIGAELAPATEGKQEKTNDGAQKAINKQHAKYREEERLKLAEQEENKKLKDKIAKLESDKGDVHIPDMPESYDDDYEVKVKERDEAIRQSALNEAQTKRANETREAQKLEAEKAESTRVANLTTDYNKSITALGLNADEIKAAGDKVIGYGIYTDVAEHIMQQQDGPLIIKHLSENPIILDELRNMTPIQAAMKINTDIREAASLLKPQASETPDPTEVLSGLGAGEADDPMIAGATFE